MPPRPGPRQEGPGGVSESSRREGVPRHLGSQNQGTGLGTAGRGSSHRATRRRVLAVEWLILPSPASRWPADKSDVIGQPENLDTSIEYNERATPLRARLQELAANRSMR